MHQPACPSYSRFDPIGTLLYFLLAIVVMIIIVSLIWKYHPPTCQQVLFTPIAILFLVLILLAPIGDVFTWYELRIGGIQTTAVVIAHRISPDAKSFYPHRITFLYTIPGPDGGICQLSREDEFVPAEVYRRYPIGSTITIWYLPSNPSIAHTESAERVSWTYAVMPFIVGAAGGLGAYLKQYKWV